MGKKKSEKATLIREIGQEEVKEVVIDPRENMTSEDIEAFMRQEEEELNKHLSRFLAANPQKPNPVDEEEEDKEEEEVFTLDLEKGVVTQVETQGLLIRDGDVTTTNYSLHEGIGTVKGNVTLDGNATIKHNPYPGMISNVLVSRAIYTLSTALLKAEDGMEEVIRKFPDFDIRNQLQNEELAVSKLRKELRAVRSPISGDVHVDKIPEWAKAYVNEYIRKAIVTLTELI